MGRYTKLTTIFTLAVMIMGLSVVASAQWRNRRGTNGSYGNTSNNNNLNSTIRNLRDKTRRFEDVLDRALDRSRYDGSRREDQLNKLAERLKNAAENLDDEYDNSRDYNRSRDEAQRVINYGSQLGRALSSSRANRNSSLQGQWRSIERDIRTISRAYNINYNGRSTRNNRSRNNRNNDRYNRNRGNNKNRNRRGTSNRNGQYNRNLRATIVNLRNKSRRFEDRLDREDNNRNSKNLEKLSNRFNDAVKDLEGEYDNDRDYNDSYDEVRKVLSRGEQVNREISRARVSRSIRSEWNSIEQDLRTLSRAYNLSYNGRRGGSTRISDIFRNLPFKKMSN